MSLLSELLESDMRELELFVTHNIPDRVEQNAVFHNLHMYIDEYKQKHGLERNHTTKQQAVTAQIAWRTHINNYCWNKGYNIPYNAQKKVID